MPSPGSSERYPVVFRKAVDAALERGSFTIPTATPEALRSRFYGFFRCLRKEGQSEAADSLKLTVSPEKDSLTLEVRDDTPEAKEIAAALKQLENLK